MPKDAQLATRMAKARTDRGMTQGQLAEKLGVRQAMVSMIETGEAEYGEDLGKRIKTFIDSGAGPATKPPRGPYKDGVSQKRRTTLPQKR